MLVILITSSKSLVPEPAALKQPPVSHRRKSTRPRVHTQVARLEPALASERTQRAAAEVRSLSGSIDVLAGWWLLVHRSFGLLIAGCWRGSSAARLLAWLVGSMACQRWVAMSLSCANPLVNCRSPRCTRPKRCTSATHTRSLNPKPFSPSNFHISSLPHTPRICNTHHPASDPAGGYSGGASA
eukprot:355455-Chlamydomonas_euryale.AAC.3